MSKTKKTEAVDKTETVDAKAAEWNPKTYDEAFEGLVGAGHTPESAAKWIEENRKDLSKDDAKKSAEAAGVDTSTEEKGSTPSNASTDDPATDEARQNRTVAYGETIGDKQRAALLAEAKKPLEDEIVQLKGRIAELEANAANELTEKSKLEKKVERLEKDKEDAKVDRVRDDRADDPTQKQSMDPFVP